jgi:type III secretion system FlhB-like substrate exporter
MTLAGALRDGNPSDEDLAAMLAQAEAGEIVEAPYDNVEEDFRGAAHATLRFMDGDACPFWLLGAMQTAFDAASDARGIEIWKDIPPAYREDPEAEGEGYSAKALADLFRVSEGFKLELITRPTLAEHIAAVLADEATPTQLYNALADAVTGLTARDEVTNSAEVIRLGLEAYAERKGGAR